jgi:hypothetical protein
VPGRGTDCACSWEGAGAGGSHLRYISETLEVRGISLQEFVVDVRPHFRNDIVNPSGFLINRARNFHILGRPAVASATSQRAQVIADRSCAVCKGQQYLLEAQRILPCPACSTPEFRRAFEIKEAERNQRIQAAQASGPTGVKTFAKENV